MGRACPVLTGVALAIGVPQADVDAKVLLGDLLIIAGGALWAATTLLVKATSLIRAPAEKGLGYQVALSIPILASPPGFPAKPWSGFPAPGAVADGLSGGLGGRIDLFDLVRAGKDLFRQQIVGFTFITPLFGVWLVISSCMTA